MLNSSIDLMILDIILVGSSIYIKSSSKKLNTPKAAKKLGLIEVSAII